jgi:6-phosphogluconate dehydrogenase
VEGVESNSTTETYFKLKSSLDHPKWRGVPFTLEAGKAVGEAKKEVVVRFKHPHPCLCPIGAPHEYHNKVIFALEPEEEITFRLWSKKPGYKLEVEKRSFDLPYRKSNGKETGEYEKLLLDCFLGDQTSFVSTNEIEAMWRFIDPVIKAWQENLVPLEIYEKAKSDIRDKAKEKINKEDKKDLVKEMAIIGLGKMGANLARNLIGNGWKVVGYNRTAKVTKKIEKDGIIGIYEYKELKTKLKKPRIVWTMVPAGEPTTQVIEEIASVLEKGDIVIDGGNSYFEESKKHYEILKEKGIDFVDVGVSGGPDGARNGACLMIGGNRKLYEHLMPLYVDIAIAEGQQHFEGIGAGHFVKMVHNGIEYGMMQAIAEGFDVLKSSEYRLHLTDIARVYNNGSVIESRLIDWMREAFEVFGDDLVKIGGSAGSGGAAGIEKSEAKWTSNVAKALSVPTGVIDEAIKVRVESQEKPGYQGKIINALRNRFGGHETKK